MAECAIMQSGSEGVTEKMNLFLGDWVHLEGSTEVPTYHCMPGYCDGGDAAHFYWPLGALPVVFQHSFVVTTQREEMGNNNNKYSVKTDTYHLKIISWQGDPIEIWRIRNFRMSEVLTSEPSTPSGLSGRICFQMVDDILSAIDGNNKRMVINLLDQYATSKKTTSGITTYTVPCLAALQLDIATGESFPAFVGASAVAIALNSISANLTRDNVVFDDDYSIITRTLIQSGSGWQEEPFDG